MAQRLMHLDFADILSAAEKHVEEFPRHIQMVFSVVCNSCLLLPLSTCSSLLSSLMILSENEAVT